MYEKVICAKKIYTMDESNPEVRWVAFEGKKIVAAGTDAVPEAAAVLNYEDSIIIPGLIDPHIHGTVAALFEKGVSLAECGCIQDVLDKIAQRAEGEDEIIIGHSLMVPFLAENRWPDRFELDKVSNGKTVAVIGYDMHGSVLNTKALESIQIEENNLGVEKLNGKITGRMISDDAHFSAISQVLGRYDNAFIEQCVDEYIQKCFSLGITGVHALEGQFVADNKDIEVWLKKKETSPLHIVVYPQVWDMDSVKKNNLPRHGGCITLDGSDMNFTMAMAEPYTSRPSTRGFLMRTDAEVYKLVSRAHSEGKQCSFHALGERAIDQLLWIYDQVIQEQGYQDQRHRIEHFTMATDEQIEHAARLGCVVVPQPELSPLFEAPSVIEQFGQERSDRMERYRIWTEKGLTVCGSSDVPINSLNPLNSIHALVNSNMDSRRLDVTTALKYYTVNPAYAAHEENERGKIAAGYYASFTVLDRDPYAEPEHINEFSIVAAIADGTVAYQK